MISGRVQALLQPTVWVTAERAFSEIFFFALFTIQAPILGPSAFGLVAAVMVFIAFWEGVPGHALTEALLSVRDIEERHFSSITSISALLCVLFGVAVFVFANPLARMLGNAELVSIMRVMSVLPLIQAFSIAPLAAAQREMRFQSTTLRTIASLFAGGLVGLTLALLGAGVWALVWQAVVQRLIAVFVLWIAVPMPFRLSFSRRHFREVGVIAMPIIVSRLMGWASGQLPRLILAIYMGPTDLGLFSLASRLNMIVNQVAIGPKATVARVALRRFANRPDKLPCAVRQMFIHLGLISFPACIGGAAVVPSLFHAWLDPRWYGAILPSQLLLLSCVPYVTFYGSTALMYAMNLQNFEVWVATALGLGGLVAVVIAGPFGLVPTSVAIAAFAMATVPLPVIVIRRTCGLTVRDILGLQVAPLLAAGGMGLFVVVLGHWLAPHRPWKVLTVQVTVGAFCYAGLLALMKPRQVVHMVRSLRVVSAGI